MLINTLFKKNNAGNFLPSLKGKSISLVGLLKAGAVFLLLLIADINHAAVIAQWGSTWSGTAASPLAATSAASGVDNTSTSVTYLKRVGLSGISSGARHNSSGWNNSSNYLEFKITTTSGNAMNLNGQSISFAMGSSNTGPSGYAVYSSVDSYATSLGSLTTSCTSTSSSSITLPSSNYNGLTTITFRIVNLNATSCNGGSVAAGGTGGPATIAVNGSVVASGPTIVIANNSQTGAQTLNPSDNDVVISKASVTISNTTATITNMKFITAGNASGYINSDIDSFKLWRSASSTFSVSTATPVSNTGVRASKTTATNTETINFSTTQSSLATGTYYYYVTVRIPASPGNNKILIVNGMDTSSITCANSVKSGSTSTTGTQTINPNTPIISSFTPSSGGAGTEVTISGTNLSSITGLTIGGNTVSTSAITTNTATQVIFTIPASNSLTNGGAIGLTNANGSTSSSGNFTVNFYLQASGTADAASSYGQDAAGTDGNTPTNGILGNYSNFIITNNSSLTLGVSLTLGTGSAFIIGDGSSATNFTIPSSRTLTGTIRVRNNSTLTLGATSFTAGAPTLDSLNSGSTVDYSSASPTTIISASYHHLSNSGNGNRTFPTTVNIAGTYTPSTGTTTLTGNTIAFNGTTAQTIPAGTYNNITLSNAAGCSISSGTVAFGGALTVNENLTVDAGATLTRNSASTTIIASGKSITVNGTFTNNSTGTFTVTGSLSFGASSTYNHAINGQVIPTATWNATSTCNVTGMTSTAQTGLGQAFGNFTWNNTGQTTFVNINSSSFSTIGTLTIASTGTSNVALVSQTASAFTNSFGNLTISGGLFYLNFINATSGTTGTSTVTVSGDVNVNGTGKLSFVGNSTNPSSSTIMTTLNVGGNITVAAAAGFYSTNTQTNARARVVLTKTGAQTIDLGASPSAGRGRLEYQVNSTSNVTLLNNLDSVASITVNGTLSDGGYLLTFAGPTFSVGSGGVLNIDNTLAIPSTVTSLTLSGTVSYGAAGTLSYRRSGNFTAGNEWPATNPPFNVTLNNSGLIYTIPGDRTVGGTLTLTAGALDIGSNLLTLNGTISGSGSLRGSNTANLAVGGTGALGTINMDQTTAGTTNRLNNFTFNRASSGTLALGNAMQIIGVVTHTDGTLTTNGNLQLKAVDSTTYGQVDPSGTGDISGTMSAEFRIVSNTGKWRQISAPLNGATLADLADDISLNYGTPDYSWTNVFRFDESRTAGRWVPATGNSQTMDDEGFAIYIFSEEVPVTIDIAGTYSKNDYTTPTLSLTGAVADSSGFHLVRNPYPSNFAWPTGITGVQANTAHVYDGQITKTYNGTTGSLPNGVIPPFHSFFVEVSGTGTITLPNSARTTSNSASYLDKTAPQNLVILSVSGKNNVVEQTHIYSAPNAQNTLDFWDARKMMNNANMPSLYTLAGKQRSAIQVFSNIPSGGFSVPAGFVSQEEGAYTITASLENIEPGVTVFLEDLKTKTMHNLSNGAYSFNHSKTNDASRFVVHYARTGATGVARETASKLYVGSRNGEVFIGGLEQEIGATVEVFDITGRSIYIQNNIALKAAQANSFNIPVMAEGYYLVRITGDGVLQNAKVYLK